MTCRIVSKQNDLEFLGQKFLVPLQQNLRPDLQRHPSLWIRKIIDGQISNSMEAVGEPKFANVNNKLLRALRIAHKEKSYFFLFRVLAPKDSLPLRQVCPSAMPCSTAWFRQRWTRPGHHNFWPVGVNTHHPFSGAFSIGSCFFPWSFWKEMFSFAFQRDSQPLLGWNSIFISQAILDAFFHDHQSTD